MNPLFPLYQPLWSSSSRSKVNHVMYHNEDSPEGEDGHAIVAFKDHISATVFDGVGGSVNSREIVEYLKSYMQSNGEIYGMLKSIRADPRRIPSGSTTIAAAKIYANNLYCMTLGDSVVQVYRNKKLAFSTKSMQCDWNTPSQMHFTPQGMLSATNPELYYTFALQSGDYVILLTDGITDNLYVNEIETVLRCHTDPKSISAVLINYTKGKNNMFPVRTPFGDSINKFLRDENRFKAHCENNGWLLETSIINFKKMMMQSKNDDCTVVVVQV